MNRYNLCTHYEGCLEESYNETIRALITWHRFEESHKERLLQNLRSASNVGTKTSTGAPYNFWKKQLSNSFKEICPMPCPLLSTLGMQRHEVSFCFECHSANTLEDWIEGHTRAMNIAPTMLQGNHTSNCVHNAKNVVKQCLRNYSDIQESTDVKFLFGAKMDAMKGKVKEGKWVTMEGIDIFMLNDEKTDTMVIQKCDAPTDYANTMAQWVMEGEDDNEMGKHWESIQKIAMAPTKLTQTAEKLEKELENKSEPLTYGCIDLARFIELARQDYLAIDLATTAERLNAAIPTEVTKLYLVGFGLLNAIELTNILLKDAIQLIRGTTFYAPKTIDIDYGNIKEIDEREIRKDCVGFFDYDTECGSKEEGSSGRRRRYYHGRRRFYKRRAYKTRYSYKRRWRRPIRSFRRWNPLMGYKIRLRKRGWYNSRFKRRRYRI